MLVSYGFESYSRYLAEYIRMFIALSIFKWDRLDPKDANSNTEDLTLSLVGEWRDYATSAGSWLKYTHGTNGEGLLYVANWGGPRSSE